MEPQKELMLILKTLIEEKLDFPISLEELSSDGEVYAELGAGYTEKKYMNGPGLIVCPVMFLTIGADEPACIDRLGKITNYLKRTPARAMPKGSTYSWRSCTVAAEPNKIGRREDGQVLYSCIVNCKICF